MTSQFKVFCPCSYTGHFWRWTAGNVDHSLLGMRSALISHWPIIQEINLSSANFVVILRGWSLFQVPFWRAVQLVILHMLVHSVFFFSHLARLLSGLSGQLFALSSFLCCRQIEKAYFKYRNLLDILLNIFKVELLPSIRREVISYPLTCCRLYLGILFVVHGCLLWGLRCPFWLILGELSLVVGSGCVSVQFKAA